MCHNLHHTIMDEIANATAPEQQFSGRWIARIVLAVILAEAIWGLIVSLTNNLVLPALASVMGGDAQSPLYLGKGDFNVPAIFSSLLELCFAGMVAVVLNQWSQRKPKPVRAKSTRIAPVREQPAAPLSPPPTQAAKPASAPPSTPPAAPAPPKEVYYNIVGEPINPTEDE